MNNNNLILVDGSSYFYRAFHAIPSLTNSQGMPTGAIYGITNMLKSLLAEYQPVYAAVIFDAKGKTFRSTLYPDYKANRPPMPDELSAQIDLTHDMVQALGFPLLIETGVEADDVIGTLAKQAETAGMQTLIFTGDKDFAQLVNDSITLIDTMKNTHLDALGILEKFGIPPTLIVDYLSLIGDSVDNVPGVKKVGPKTAVKWLNTYGNLETIIANAAQIKGKVGENLRAALPHLSLTHQLLTIKCDVPLSSPPQHLKLKPPNFDKLYQLYTELNFNKWLTEIKTKVSPDAQKAKKETLKPKVPSSPLLKEKNDQKLAVISNQEKILEVVILNEEENLEITLLNEEQNLTEQRQYHTILTQTEFEEWLNRLNEAQLFAFDTETTSLNYLQAEIVGVSFAVQAGEAAYVPLAHDYLGAPPQLARDKVLAALKPLLENPHKAKIGQNFKYDAHVLANHGIILQNQVFARVFDTMLESYVLNSTEQHNLDALANKYLNLQTIKFEEIAGKGQKQLTFNQIALEQAGPYASEDADITLQLHQVLGKQLQIIPTLGRIFQYLEMPLIPVLMRMERYGVKIDAFKLHQQSLELADKLQIIEKEAYGLAGTQFNLNSPKQLQTILFEQLGLPVLKKTPKKEPSTAVEVLEELALDYPLPQLILEYRSLSKLKSTYTDALPRQINPKTGRIHTSYQQSVAATGRLSSTNPNLQNIPIRTPEGRRIRQAFVAPPGYCLLAADYSQIELRIMAHLSEDSKLLAAFGANEDIHKATAAEVFNLPIEQVTPEQRRRAKAVNFGLIYGMQAYGLAKQLGIERSEAQIYIDAYFARYPGVKNYMDAMRELAKQQGYVETLFGRRLAIPEIKSRNHQRRQYAERTAINAPMQGTAADLIKRAMLNIDAWIQTSDSDLKMLMQVHDELVFEVAQEIVEDAKTHIIEAMIQVAELKVPLLVDIGIGLNWDEAH